MREDRFPIFASHGHQLSYRAAWVLFFLCVPITLLTLIVAGLTYGHTDPEAAEYKRMFLFFAALQLCVGLMARLLGPYRIACADPEKWRGPTTE